jgi:hypothetical protein
VFSSAYLSSAVDRGGILVGEPFEIVEEIADQSLPGFKGLEG